MRALLPPPVAQEALGDARKTHWPRPENSHTENDYYPIFSDCHITLPAMSPWVEAMASDAGVQADTIEELAEKMGVPADEFVATVERYNELAKKGEDEDFGKRADRMFAIENPPYYAYKLTDTVLLVCMGGLQTNVDFQVLDTDDEVIPNLYAVGNTQGGRFLVDYPLPCPGISHGMAMTHGMLVGRILAKL